MEPGRMRISYAPGTKGIRQPSEIPRLEAGFGASACQRWGMLQLANRAKLGPGVSTFSTSFVLIPWNQNKTGGKFRNSRDRKSTRLNSSPIVISYAVFCFKKKIGRGTAGRAGARARRYWCAAQLRLWY